MVWMPVGRWLRLLIVALVAAGVGVVPARPQALPPSASELLDSARGLFERGSWEAALEKYQQFVTANPQSTQLPDALWQAGECCYALDRHDQALGYYLRLTEQFPEAEQSLHGWYRQGDIQLRQGKLAEAAEAFRVMLTKGPKSPLASGAAYWLGEALYRQGKTTEAVAAYEQCLALQPDPNYAAYANYSIGLLKVRAGDLEGGKARLQAVLDEHSGHELAPEVTYLLGEASLLGKDYEGARQLYQKVVDAYPKSRSALLAKSGLGRVLSAAGEYAEALPIFEEVARGPDPEAAHEAAMRAADCLYVLGRYAEAASAYGAVADDPANPQASLGRFWAAMALERQPDKPAAVQAFTQFVTAQPQHERAVEAYLHLGTLQAESGDLEAAGKSYQLAEAGARDGQLRLQAQFGAAWVTYRRAPSDQALDEMEKLAAEAPHNDVTAQMQGRVGGLRLARGEYARAILLLSRLVQDYPKGGNVPETLYLLGLAHEKAGEVAPAAEAYGRVVAQHPGSPYATEARGRLAVLAARAGRLQDARALIAQVKQQAPDSAALAQATMALAEALSGQKEYAQAAAEYAAVLASKPGDLAPDAEYGLGACRLALGDLPGAIEAFRRCATTYPQAPNAPLARYQLGAALLRSGDARGAAEQLEALLAAGPPADLAAEALLDLGWAYTDLKDTPRALTAFARLVHDFPQASYAAEAQFRLGELHFAQGDYPASQKAYELVLANDQGSVLTDAASYKLGWALLKQAKLSAAIGPLLAAAGKTTDPAIKADAQYQAASCLLSEARFEEAAKLLQELRRQPPRDLEVSVLLLLGQAYLGLKDYDRATPAFQEIIARRPEDPLAPRALLGLGRVLKGQRKYDEAAAALAKSIGAPGKQTATEAQFELAEVRLLQGDARSAAAEYLKVAERGTDPRWAARALYAAGLCYEQAKAPEGAAKAYKGVLEQYPDQTEWIAKAQERLRVLQESHE
jgi:cellulose synthase operon protein C